MRALGSPGTALADGMAGPNAGSLAIRPIVALARDSLRKAVTRLRCGAGRLGDSPHWAQDRMVFNVYEGLEMHGWRG